MFPPLSVCPCVNICWRREESLWPNSFVMTNFQNTWCSCFLLVWMVIRHIPQSGARFGEKPKSMRRTLWQSGKSRHCCWRRWPFIFRCPSKPCFQGCVVLWRGLFMRVPWKFTFRFKESPLWGYGFRKVRLVLLFCFCLWNVCCADERIFCPCVAFFSERGYRGFGQSAPSFAGSVTESTSGRAVLHWVFFPLRFSKFAWNSLHFPIRCCVIFEGLARSMLNAFRRKCS